MEQEVKYINIKDLVLWTENPRDPIDENATDQDISDRAFEDRRSKWSLSKLAKQMGNYYDFSELPTVVFHEHKPVVYDGNRRVILGKIKHGIVTVPEGINFKVPEIPMEIPCNICSERIALNNVWRKHGNSGSWGQLEQDIFLHKFLGHEKSSFLILEEETGLISANPHLNKDYVQREIFNKTNLNKLGFEVVNGRLYSVHSDNDSKEILADITKKIGDKITTRKARGKVIEVLEPSSQQLIDQNKNNKRHLSKIHFKEVKNGTSQPKRQSPRTSKKKHELFGGVLYLQYGEVSNLYRDIKDLYAFYISKRNELSQTFPGLIRMSLRLLCETAAKEDNNKKFENYLKGHFPAAKKTLDKNIKTTLSNHNVNEKSIIQLLHTGAHNYQSSNNTEQTIAMSIIIGAILTISHGKEKSI